MKLETCLVLFLCGLSHCMRRGPHHPHGQKPVDAHHHHYVPAGDVAVTDDLNLMHDFKHIMEDLEVLSPEAIEKMTPEELEFHYFSAHDFDKNSKLDGLELLKAIFHMYEHEEQEQKVEEQEDVDLDIEPEQNKMDAYIDLVDRTLEKDDADGDGYLSYAEYRAARESSSRKVILLAKRARD